MTFHYFRPINILDGQNNNNNLSHGLPHCFGIGPLCRLLFAVCPLPFAFIHCAQPNMCLFSLNFWMFHNLFNCCCCYYFVFSFQRNIYDYLWLLARPVQAIARTTAWDFPRSRRPNHKTTIRNEEKSGAVWFMCLGPFPCGPVLKVNIKHFSSDFGTFSVRASSRPYVERQKQTTSNWLPELCKMLEYVCERTDGQMGWDARWNAHSWCDCEDSQSPAASLARVQFTVAVVWGAIANFKFKLRMTHTHTQTQWCPFRKR